MKANIILRAMLKESVSTESCGIVRVPETMAYTEFVRQYLYSDFQDAYIDYYRFIAPAGEYFYCWHSSEINFGFGQGYYSHEIEGQFLHIIPMEADECEVVY